MRRQLLVVMFMLLATVALISVHDRTSKVDTVSAMPDPPTAIIRTVDGAIKPLTLKAVEMPDGPSAVNAGPATNTCLSPTELGTNDGGSTPNIRDFTVDLNDPILSCMWGDPADDRGYRTAWYIMQPDEYGIVSLDTSSSNYDTVLAVHRGTCGAFIELACNDDENYFTSRLELQVLAGETYYVEVADWHSAASGQMVLNLRSEPQPINSLWETASTGSPVSSFRSRHIVVADGDYLYVIGGQTSIGSTSDRTPVMYRYNTTTQSTIQLPNMPGGSDGKGYSNTTAALVNGRIYVPSGDTGGVYDGTHLAYDIAAGSWSPSWPAIDQPANNNWVAGQPSIFAQATPYTLDGPLGAGYFLSGGLIGAFPVNDNSSNWSPRAELYFYSASLNSWSTLTSLEMPFGRFGHVAALQSIGGQDHLCVAAGMGGIPGTNREVLNSTYCLDLDQGTSWDEVGSLNYERYFASGAVDSQGNWYVIGGYDAQGNLVGVSERYEPESGRWIVLSPGYSVVPTRAWSRGAFVGNEFWIIGGETVDQGVLNEVQHATFASGPIFNYLPVMLEGGEIGRQNDTMATARQVNLPTGFLDRFYTPYDIVNIYSVDVAVQPIRIRLDPLNSGNDLDLVIYSDNKGFVDQSRLPGNNIEELTLRLSPGRYYIAVERVFPLVGNNPSQQPYLLEIVPG